MKTRFKTLATILCLLISQAAVASSFYMVLEKDILGQATHQTADLTTLGEGLDPVLQFILFNEPADPSTAQVLWQASRTPVQWVLTSDERPYSMVEYATLPEGSRLEYRVFLQSNGAEIVSLQHTREAGDEEMGLDASLIDTLPESQYEIQVKVIVPERPTQTLKQRLDVVEFAQELEPGTTSENRNIPTLVPGTGWRNDQATPSAVGDPAHPGFAHSAIARWAVVPHQVFEGDFKIGVGAFHSYGIDRVSFSVNGGPWQDVREMATNPRTGVEEYFVNLDAQRFPDGKVTVRAIAYPNHGIPRLVGDLELFANAEQTLSFPVIELDAGRHHLSGLTDRVVEKDGWLTIRPKPGVAKEDCIITGVDRITKDGHLKIQGVTMVHDGGNDFLYGNKTGEGWVWLDNVKVIGNGRENATSWLAHLWGRQFYTNCEITKVRSVFHGGGGGLFARNVDIYDIYEDVFRNHGYVANVTIDGVDRGDTSFHPDLFDFAYTWKQHNVIYQDVTVRNAFSLGMAGGEMEDIAIINCDVHTPGWTALEIGGELKNVVFKNSRFKGGARLRNAQPDGVMIENSRLGWRDPFLPEGWKAKGVTVLDHPVDIDKNE